VASRDERAAPAQVVRDAEGLPERVRAAATPARSAGELYDGFLAAIAETLGVGVRASIYTAEDDRLWLEAQLGHGTVIHTVPIGDGPLGDALAAGTPRLVPDPVGVDDDAAEARCLALPFAVGEATHLACVELSGEPTPTLREALEGAVRELGEALGGLTPRARAMSPLTWLSRTFVRMAAQRDAAQLLELASGAIGELAGLDLVQGLLGDRVALGQVSLWRRTPTVPAALPDGAAAALAAATGWQPAEVATGPATGAELAALGLSRALILPLVAGGEVLGLLVGAAATPDRLAHLEEVELVAAHAATALGNLRSYEAVVQASLTDGLTGLPNHRRFHEDGAALIEACKVSGERFALVICDLDDFKDLNDRRGHVAGDDALRLVAGLLANGLRPDDRAFRLGGEEFGLLLPATTKPNARTVCRRLQRSLAQVDLDGWRLTQSMGISSFAEDGETIRDLYAAADAALYEAKRLGKDRITLADEKLLARRTQGLSMAVRGRRSFEQMRHLQALASALVGARTRARVGEAIVAELASALPSDASCACLLDDDGVLRRVAGAGPEHPALLSFAARAIAEQRSFLVDDAREAHPELATVPLAGVAASPLFAERRIVGALVVAAAQFSRFDRDDQRLLEVIAHLGGLACENLRLLGEQSTAMEAASGLASRFAACASVEDVVRVAVETISEHVRCDRATVRLVETEEDVRTAERLPRMLRVPDEDGGASLLLPASADGRPQAVVELACSAPIDDEATQLLEQIVPSLALAIAAQRAAPRERRSA
jgi:diguanylate cyclase (GGDEF)-like protein